MVFVEFAALFLVLMLAAYLLSHGAETLTEKWGANLVGSIILGLFTTLPEYMFVFWASMKGRYDMAVGSAIGSCTILVTLGYGMVILLATSRLSRKPVTTIRLSRATRIDALYLMLTGLAAFVAVWRDNALDPVEALILALLFVGYVYQVCRATAAAHREDPKDVPLPKLLRAGGIMLAGGVLVLLVAEPFVTSMLALARQMSISPVVIAIIIGPFASEMPEKLTAYITVLRNGHMAELSICNFIGAKINHNSLLLALIPLVRLFHTDDGGFVPGMMSVSFGTMTVLTVIVSLLLARGKVERWEGGVLIGCYLLTMYLASLA
ncbi:MAG: sodium:calcium antiporter [Armatimonadetes bacterium]|nr:sodium:calcium antiporter [Armatimonadota bacterium]